MIARSNGNLRDINHFMKVYSYALTIGRLEKLDPQTLEILEVTALIHDIAVPLCRMKYGSTAGNYQEAESEALVKEFLGGLGLPEYIVGRAAYLAAHHHTYTGVDGADYRILLEADFLVNADEGNLSREAIEYAEKQFFRSESGKRLLRLMFLRDAAENDA